MWWAGKGTCGRDEACHSFQALKWCHMFLVGFIAKFLHKKAVMRKNTWKFYTESSLNVVFANIYFFSHALVGDRLYAAVVVLIIKKTAW